MSIVTKNKSKAAQKLICLKKTRHITQDDLFLPEWETIKKEYDELQGGEWVDKAIVSLLNSALFQRRVVFVLAKRSFRELAKSDKNWTRQIGLKDENWKSLIQEITSRDIVKCIHKTEKGRLVYEIIEEDILNLLNIDVNAQRNEAIQFANEMNDLDEGTTQGTTEGNREEEIERELEDKLNQTNNFEEEEIDLSMDSRPTYKNNFLPPVKKEISADPIPNSQNHAPVKSNSVAPSTNTPIVNSVTFGQLVNSWIVSVGKPLDHLNYKNMTSSISSIVNTCKQSGLERSEISSAKFVKLVFSNIRKSQKITEWQDQVAQCLEQQADAAYTRLEFANSTAENALGIPDLQPEAVEYYKRFLEQGKTPADFGGRSLVDYANERAYADSFPTIDHKKLP